MEIGRGIDQSTRREGERKRNGTGEEDFRLINNSLSISKSPNGGKSGKIRNLKYEFKTLK